MPKLPQPSLPGLCPLTSAIDEMASSGVEERGAIFTRVEVVEFLLDLVGYTSNKKLFERRILEPSFGHGDFLMPTLERLLKSWTRWNGSIDASILKNAIQAVELHQDSFEKTRASVIERLSDEMPGRTARSLADAWFRQGDFLLEPISGEFDFAVGNPPYVRIEKIPVELVTEYRNRYRTIYDRADLYIPFIERCLSLLAPKGQLGFICADRWMKNRYGAPLRKMVAEEFHLKCYVDMVDTPAFHSDVIAYPAITVIAREKSNCTKVVSRPEISKTHPTALAREISGNGLNGGSIKTVSSVTAGDAPWLLSDCDKLALARRLEQEFPTIEEAGCQVGIGVATGADKVFIGPYDELDVEEDRKLPLATTRDIQSGVVNWSGLGIVNPFSESGKLVKLSAFPKLQRFFENNEGRLKQRHIAKKVPANWYRTIDRIHESLTHKPKLLIPDIKGHANIVFEPGKLYPHHNLYFVTSDDWDLQALQGILKAGIAHLFVSLYSTQMRGGYFRFQAQHLRRIRLPLWSEIPTELRNDLVKAAKDDSPETCIALTAELFSLSQAEAKVLQSICKEVA